LGGRVLTGRGDGHTHGYVTRLEPATLTILAFHELLGRSFWVSPVLLEDGGATKLDLTGPLTAIGINFFTWLNDLTRVNIH
jgi:hypothetical protein